ncbi:hypothetical protein ACFE04_002611 [Oxalis oulophora]
MTVEDKRGSSSCEDDAMDNFPIGMRVLAVDDDPTCLRVLEGLLRKCQYHVTTTNQAITALKMLRENRNNFDLIISDVNMPDMDGFKLLELVGLEMDLPVIMLSSHSDTKLVMKGIQHGACDYLLKPCRLEELKNIWQHVLRKKKVEPKNKNKSSNNNNDREYSEENRNGETNAVSGDQNGRVNKRRKDQDQDDDDDEDGDEDDQDNEESNQKKPRVVWSVELHRKFVQAVNQLGLEKAVPKKILDLMNVDGLTRENKYRLYLKRINTTSQQEANMVAAFGPNAFGDFQALTGAGRYPNTGISPYQSGSVLSRLNAPSPSLSLRGIPSTGLIQPGHSQTFNNNFNFLGKFQSSVVHPTNNLFQVNQLAQNKPTTGHGDFNPTNFSFTDTRGLIGRPNNSVPSLASNPLIGQVNPQSRTSFGNPSFDLGVRSTTFVDQSRSVDSWQAGGVPSSRFPSNSTAFNDPFSQIQLPANNLRDNASPNSSQIGNNNPIDFSSSVAVPSPLEDSRSAVSCQMGLIGNVIQNYPAKQTWDEHRQDFGNNSFGSANNGPVTSLGQSIDQSNAMNGKLRSNDNNYLLEQQTKTNENFMQNNFDPLDDLMSVMMKRDSATNGMQQQNDGLLMDGGELGFDAYSLGSSCI